MSNKSNNSNEEKKASQISRELKCMGEFPLFPGWLFFERCDKENNFHVSAYGSSGRKIRKVSDSREYAIAECLRNILGNQ